MVLYNKSFEIKVLLNIHISLLDLLLVQAQMKNRRVSLTEIPANIIIEPVACTFNLFPHKYFSGTNYLQISISHYLLPKKIWRYSSSIITDLSEIITNQSKKWLTERILCLMYIYVWVLP